MSVFPEFSSILVADTLHARLRVLTLSANGRATTASSESLDLSPDTLLRRLGRVSKAVAVCYTRRLGIPGCEQSARTVKSPPTLHELRSSAPAVCLTCVNTHVT